MPEPDHPRLIEKVGGKTVETIKERTEGRVLRLGEREQPRHGLVSRGDQESPRWPGTKDGDRPESGAV